MATTSYRFKRHSSELGGAMLEFALSIPVVLSMLFGGTDLFRVIFVQISLMDGVGKASRYAALGFKQSDDPAPANPVQSVRQILSEYSRIEIRPQDLFVCNYNEFLPLNPLNCRGNSAANTRGAKAQWMYLEVRTSVPLLFGLANIPLKSSTIFRNEPTMSFHDFDVLPNEEINNGGGSGTPTGRKGGNMMAL